MFGVFFPHHLCAPLFLIALGVGELSPFKTWPFGFAT